MSLSLEESKMLALRTAQPALRALGARQSAASLPSPLVAGRRAAIAPAATRAFSASSCLHKVAVRYTKEHEWVKFDDTDGMGIIGITEYAQKSLGDVVYVELPSEGSEVQQGEQIGAVESVKAASDIYSPVSGKITSVNDKLGDQPGLLNKSPEQDGECGSSKRGKYGGAFSSPLRRIEEPLR